MSRLERPTDGVQPSDRHMRDIRWRIQNLYKIRTKSGKVETLKPNWAQWQIIESFMQGKRRQIMPKARQLGCSTISAILALDAMLFSTVQVGVVHLTDDKAADMLNIMRLAYNEAPDWLKQEVGLTTDQARRMVFSNGSSVTGGINLRGSTFQFLIVSELAPIEDQSEAKAIEIRDGLLPTVPQDGVVIIESTSKGPKGIYHQMTMRAVKDAELSKAAEKAGKKYLGGSGFHALFLPWWRDPGYIAQDASNHDAMAALSVETKNYFRDLQKQLRAAGIYYKFTPQQALWYQRQKQISGTGILTEYPSNIDEAFMGVSELSIYNDELLRAYSDGRISPHHVPDRRFGPVYIAFDLGGKTKHSDKTVLTFAQFDGNTMRVLHSYKSRHTNFDDYLQYALLWCQSHGLRIGAIILPHDARNEYRGTDTTVERQVIDAGIAPVVVVPRTASVWGDITIVKAELPYMTFWMAGPDSRIEDDGCRGLLGDLRAYRRKKNRTTGLVEDEPYHGPESDTADSFRMLVMAKYAGLLSEYAYDDVFVGHTFGDPNLDRPQGFEPRRGAFLASEYASTESISGSGGGFGTGMDYD